MLGGFFGAGIDEELAARLLNAAGGDKPDMVSMGDGSLGNQLRDLAVAQGDLEKRASSRSLGDHLKAGLWAIGKQWATRPSKRGNLLDLYESELMDQKDRGEIVGDMVSTYDDHNIWDILAQGGPGMEQANEVDQAAIDAIVKTVNDEPLEEIQNKRNLEEIQEKIDRSIQQGLERAMAMDRERKNKNKYRHEASRGEGGGRL